MEATSHIALEVALAVRPNVCLVGEEIAEKRLSLEDIVNVVADAVCLRAHEGKNFGTVLVPEGLLASVLECRVLMSELGKCKVPCTPEEAVSQMSSFSAALMKSFPEYIQTELLLERQSNGQIQLSQVQTERLIADMVTEELTRRKSGGASNRAKSFVGTFSPVCQFVGYQARCSMPSNFDCCYGRALGKTAGILAISGCNGYLATVSGLGSSLEKWRCAGAPISSVSTHSEDGSARVAPQPILMHGPAWRAWSSIRARCVMEDEYRNPGPIQFSGTSADRVTETLSARSSQWGSSLDYLSTLDELEEKVNLLRQVCRPGCEVSLARVASRMLGSMDEIVSLVSEQRAP
jgi:diphosphate--fructose-6-phosphate 1-phosphotransferase